MTQAREIVLDVRGKLCPAPILELAQLIALQEVGTVIVVHSDDAAIAFDLPAWCQSTGHRLLKLKQQGNEHLGRVRKMHDRAL